MRVLVCDDDATVREFLHAMFGVEGWDAEAVESGEQALEKLSNGPLPDVLVIDQVMPGLQGIEVADQLRAQGFDRPIILCSAFLGPKYQGDIKRLDLLPVNKIDVQAVIRFARAAVQEHEQAARQR